MIPGATLISVLRHGEVAGQSHVYRGASDVGMSALGLRQVHAAVARIATPPFDRIASSPYRRCHEFARAYAGEVGVQLELIEPFREMSFGAWEGMTPQEAGCLDPAAYASFCTSPDSVAPPGGETVMQLMVRVAAGWDTWLHNSTGGHRLLVTHAGVMRALLVHVLGLPVAHAYRIALPEAAHFQVSVLAGHAPILLNLNSCAA